MPQLFMFQLVACPPLVLGPVVGPGGTDFRLVHGVGGDVKSGEGSDEAAAVGCHHGDGEVVEVGVHGCPFC